MESASAGSMFGRRNIKKKVASLPAKCRQLGAKVLPWQEGYQTDLDREFEGLEVIAWRQRIILPTNPLRAGWDWVLILLVIYSALAVPLELCFTYETPVGIMALDWFVDVFFILDLFLNFRTAYAKPDGTLEIEPKLVVNHYLWSWFLIDLVASIPFERLAGGDPDNKAGALTLAKMPRLLRLSRLLKKLDMFTSARAMRVLSVLIFFLMFTHFVGCFWWLIGISQGAHGWQFQQDLVPLLLQDIEWDAVKRHELTATPWEAAEPGAPDWLPDMYNHSSLLEFYESEVGLGKAYITSLYWALTMVMKSPWLPPQSTGEQLYASMVVIFGAIVFAAFLGHVTTMIQSYEKSNALYRDQMTNMHHFFESRSISRPTQKAILTYTDAYFKARVEGVPERTLVMGLPAHLRPPVLMEVYRSLLEACTFLQDCSYSGCADFLQRLDPEVCLKGDTLIRAGTTTEYMYILMTGELQVSYPPEGTRIRKITHLLGSSAAAVTGPKQSSRIPQGRVERRGSLIGWQPPYGPLVGFKYTVKTYRFSQLFSITRTALREVLENHPIDASTFSKAVEHASKTLAATKGSCKAMGGEGGTRMSTACGADMEHDEKSSSPYRRASTGLSGAKVSAACELSESVMESEEAKRQAAKNGFLPPRFGARAGSAAGEEVGANGFDSATTGRRSSSDTGAPSAEWMQQRERTEQKLSKEIAEVREQMQSGMAEIMASLNALHEMASLNAIQEVRDPPA